MTSAKKSPSALIALTRLEKGSTSYPAKLRTCLGDGAPGLSVWGDAGLLRQSLLGFFCSVRCPGDALLATYDLARALRDAGVAVIGGFHSPMEKECLTFLLRGAQPVVICPARSLEDMRPAAAWRSGLKEGRVLVLSPFAAPQRRATAELAQRRNLLVAALADVLFLSHAERGGKTEALARQALAWGKPVWTLDHPGNQELLAAGVRAVAPAGAAAAWQAHLTEPGLSGLFS